ncbi:endonuclease III [Polyangium mundeleinium]|uniref:Endonuclease III n=1 Tax=Polyangium mundeleinium TaxID=2995306 RepID=A0ABT5EUN8_9BACT|nr:endonuclease III [Polyangium mundeleinium]MDC0745149.1 endonuclease III [Polyangium mundeleinium]
MTATNQARALAQETFRRLRVIHPDAHCELDHANPFQLLVATVLSAQTTDVLVNQITPKLFGRWPDAPSLAKAPVAEVAALLRERLGMFNQKGKNIVGLAKKLVEKHGGEVPRTLAALVELPGVGRKTANVVLGVAFGRPEGVVVDTHVQRLSQRLGWTTEQKPETIEKALCALFPPEDWNMLSLVLIFHGRRVCFAKKPACAACGVNDACPSAFAAENVGRKPPRKRPAVVTEAAPKKKAAATKGVTKKAATTKATTKKVVVNKGSATRIAPQKAAAKGKGSGQA